MFVDIQSFCSVAANSIPIIFVFILYEKGSSMVKRLDINLLLKKTILVREMWYCQTILPVCVKAKGQSRMGSTG